MKRRLLEVAQSIAGVQAKLVMMEDEIGRKPVISDFTQICRRHNSLVGELSELCECLQELCTTVREEYNPGEKS